MAFIKIKIKIQTNHLLNHILIVVRGLRVRHVIGIGNIINKVFVIEKEFIHLEINRNNNNKNMIFIFQAPKISELVN